MDSVNREASCEHRGFTVTFLLPLIALSVFVGMIAAGETQIRRSPKWPPPAQHELGGWEIDDPAVLDWAAGLNLPATLPILWMWAHNDAFSYAFDDHQLIVYVPWLLFATCLWYFVAYRINQFTSRPHLRETKMRHIVMLAIQIFITFEVLYAAVTTASAGFRTTHIAEAVCTWAWLLAVILGWVDTFSRPAISLRRE